MITFERFECKSIYGGDYLMDNSYRILSDNNEIGVFHFSNPKNCDTPLHEGDMFIEFIQLFKSGYARAVLGAIFHEFNINRIIGETNDDNKPFWTHIGAAVPDEYSDEFREMYCFSLFSDNLMSNTKSQNDARIKLIRKAVSELNIPLGDYTDTEKEDWIRRFRCSKDYYSHIVQCREEKYDCHNKSCWDIVVDN